MVLRALQSKDVKNLMSDAQGIELHQKIVDQLAKVEFNLQIIFILQIESYFEIDLFFCNVNKVYIYIYITAVKVNNTLTKRNFNGTNFINAARIFCLTRGPTRSWRNGDAQCCQLSNIADAFKNFFPFKKALKPYLVSENRW